VTAQQANAQQEIDARYFKTLQLIANQAEQLFNKDQQIAQQVAQNQALQTEYHKLAQENKALKDKYEPAPPPPATEAKPAEAPKPPESVGAPSSTPASSPSPAPAAASAADSSATQGSDSEGGEA
jgi:hypothetical protein